MHLVEAEAVGPIEGDDPVPTPPRPPHRRVSVSLLFTLSVLIGLVVTIYMVFPARRDEIVTVAIREHRVSDATWDLTSPTPSELRAWAIGVAGKDVPLPAEANQIVGARRVEVLRQPAALIRMQVGGETITYLVQHSRGIAPERVTRSDGDIRALSSRTGRFTYVAVGTAATADAWSRALR